MLPVAHKRRPRRTPSGLELPRADGRTLAARRFRALCLAFEAELGGDLTEPDKALVKQAANLTLAAELQQADIVSGVRVDSDALIRISSEARRVLGVLRAKAARNKPLNASWSPMKARLGTPA